MKPYRELFMLCRNCEGRGRQRQWLVDIMQCRCIFLEVV